MQELGEKTVRFEITTSIFWLVIGMVLLSGGIIYRRMLLKIKTGEWTEFECVIAFVLVIGAIAGVPIVVCQILDMIRCIQLPDMVVYEYISSILKPYGSK